MFRRNSYYGIYISVPKNSHEIINDSHMPLNLAVMSSMVETA